MSRGQKILVKCDNCRVPFYARKSDRARGWGRFCTKSCKATKQEKLTGQYRSYLSRVGVQS